MHINVKKIRSLVSGHTEEYREYKASRASQANMIDREIPYSGNWHKESVSLMRELLRLKWEQVLVFREKLQEK